MSNKLLIKQIRAENKLPKYDDTKLTKLLDGNKIEIPPTPRGRIRILNALRDKFGKSFKQRSDVQDVLNEFEKHVDFSRQYIRLRSARG